MQKDGTKGTALQDYNLILLGRHCLLNTVLRGASRAVVPTLRLTFACRAVGISYCSLLLGFFSFQASNLQVRFPEL